MTDGKADSKLVVQRKIQAPRERVFAAWTQPEHLTRWWGPKGVECPEATVDLRVGGMYRIANRFQDGRVVWITGEFERVERPRLLVYSWRMEPGAGSVERVTVSFEPDGDTTDVVVTHERIPDPKMREGHEAGWQGCLEGLDTHLTRH
jgi:uncharacterized protein YndB with AHSA1/START domain